MVQLTQASTSHHVNVDKHDASTVHVHHTCIYMCMYIQELKAGQGSTSTADSVCEGTLEMSWTGLEPTTSRDLDQSEPVHAGLLLSSFSSLFKTCTCTLYVHIHVIYIYIHNDVYMCSTKAQLALLNPDNVHVQWACSRKVVRQSLINSIVWGPKQCYTCM